MEGISYYMEGYELERILQEFSTKKQINRIFIEYLTPCRCIEPSRQMIPRRIFGYIRGICGIQIQSYLADDLDEMLERCGGVTEQVYNMSEMERMRTGKQTYFLCTDSGWIECLIARL